MNKYLINALIYIGIPMMFLCSGCNEIEREYKYEILQAGNSEKLLFFYYGPNIVGIDTVTFSVEARVRIDNMSIGGVTKLPNGGIAFTHHRRVSDNAWGNTLYVTDENYNIINKYPICHSPMGPKVVNNVLLVGSSAIEGGKSKLQLYNTHNFELIKEFLLDDMVDAWQIHGYDHYAYFGVYVSMPFRDRESSYIVQLDLNTQDTTEFSLKTDFFEEAALAACRQDSLLYVFNIVKKDISTVNLNNRTIHSIEMSKYPEIAAEDAENILCPKVIDGHLYGLLGRHDEEGHYTCNWLKLNAFTFDLEDIKKLELPEGSTTGDDLFSVGRFFIIKIRKDILFINAENGELIKTVALDVDYF